MFVIACTALHFRCSLWLVLVGPDYRRSEALRFVAEAQDPKDLKRQKVLLPLQSGELLLVSVPLEMGFPTSIVDLFCIHVLKYLGLCRRNKLNVRPRDLFNANALDSVMVAERPIDLHG
jgi:hypothetical protein